MNRRAAILVPLVLALAVPHARASRGTGPGGYTWKDCLELDGPACGYTNVAVSDSTTGLCSEEIYDDPADGIGFPFQYYGVTYSDYAVSANGVVYLSNAPACCDDVNADLTGFEGRSAVAVLWDDWAMDNKDDLQLVCANPGCSNTGPFDAVESFQRGRGTDAGVAFLDFEWYSTAHHRPICTEDLGEQATFGMRLYADGRILFQYQDVAVAQPDVDFGASATIGVTSGFDGKYTLVSFDTASIPQVPYAILFEPPPCPTLSCDAIDITPLMACNGATQQFTAAITGGQAPLTVDWDFNGDTVRDARGNPASYALGSGTWPVTVTVTDSCSPPSTCTRQIRDTIFPLPTPSITPSGSTRFCAATGESVTLTANGGYRSYQWQLDGIDIAGETAPTTVASRSGNWVVLVVDGNGCTGKSVPIVVVADDCPPPCSPLVCDSIDIAPNPACQGDPQQLTLAYSGGTPPYVITWDLDGDGTFDTAGNPVFTSRPPGVITVRARVSDDCTNPFTQSCSLTQVLQVRATPRPAVAASGPLVFCAADGESVTLDATPGFADYKWEKDGLTIAGATTLSLLVTATGSYVVRVLDDIACAGASAPVDVNSDQCLPACPDPACGAITVTPEPSCEGQRQTLSVDASGGTPPLQVRWDVDGDTMGDITGNPVQVSLPVGTHPLTALVFDSCVSPGPHSCTSTVNATVLPGAATLSEVSAPGQPPLRVAPRATSVTFASQAAATAYNVYVGAIGTWYAPSIATGSRCALATWTDNGDGTLTIPGAIPVGSWIVVTASNACGEGLAGTNSRGVERSADPRWQRCGAAP